MRQLKCGKINVCIYLEFRRLTLYLLYVFCLAQQYERRKDCQKPALRYMAVRFTPHFPPIPPAHLFLSFRAMALGQVHLQGVRIEMHWSFTQETSLFPHTPILMPGRLILHHFSVALLGVWNFPITECILSELYLCVKIVFLSLAALWPFPFFCRLIYLFISYLKPVAELCYTHSLCVKTCFYFIFHCLEFSLSFPCLRLHQNAFRVVILPLFCLLSFGIFQGTEAENKGAGQMPSKSILVFS